MPLSARDRQTRDDFIRLFGRERFTIRDLWRQWVGRPQWPTREFAAEMEGELARLSFVEPAPGPRGGQGWRVMPAVVADLERDRADHAAWIDRQNQPHKAAAEALESRYADITVCEDTQRVRVAYPNLKLAPRWIGMHFQDVTVGAITAEPAGRPPHRSGREASCRPARRAGAVSSEQHHSRASRHARARRLGRGHGPL